MIKVLLTACLFLSSAYTIAQAQTRSEPALEAPGEEDSPEVRKIERDRAVQMRALQQQQRRLAKEQRDMRSDARRAAGAPVAAGQAQSAPPRAAPQPGVVQPKAKPRCVGVCD